jgi:hypothetical protein
MERLTEAVRVRGDPERVAGRVAGMTTEPLGEPLGVAILAAG